MTLPIAKTNNLIEMNEQEKYAAARLHAKGQFPTQELEFAARY